ncbi:hypothetical protein, partial [Pedobacter agri]|uniref:hypothetical protein n=1 Tax=Pedobacter agri TaxID=454586 RepID=UPI001EE67C95
VHTRNAASPIGSFFIFLKLYSHEPCFKRMNSLKDFASQAFVILILVGTIAMIISMAVSNMR